MSTVYESIASARKKQGGSLRRMSQVKIVYETGDCDESV